VLVWFLRRLWLLPVSGILPLHKSRPGSFRRFLPRIFAFAGPWLFWAGWTGRDTFYPFAATSIFDALWPVAIALPVALILLRQRLPEYPPGDLLLLMPGWRLPKVEAPRQTPRAGGDRLVDLLPQAIAKADRFLIRWSISGALLPILVFGFLVLLM
jgi:hypothetical protein